MPGVALSFASFLQLRDQDGQPLLEILERAWTQERFSFEGSFYKYRNITVIPRPLQRFAQPVRTFAVYRGG